MTADEAKAAGRAELRRRLESIEIENEARLLEAVLEGDLDLDQAEALAETMRTANRAELPQTEAVSDRVIDQLHEKGGRS